MKYAMITGATGGIGYELARVFCREGCGVVIVSSDSERLENTKRKLEKEFGAAVTAYEQDLSLPGAAVSVYSRVKADGITPDVLVNNAGFGLAGAADNIDFEHEERMMVLNMISLSQLTRLALTDMYERRSGKILNVSSIGGFQPGPYTASYFAGKAFVTSYSRAVRFEARKKNIDVCILCPGATRTGFFRKEGTETPSNAMDPETTARYAYRQLMKNREFIIPGFLNRIMVQFPVRLKMVYVARSKAPEAATR
ncbi:SDR family NAD(P)-dependent oxidoreductase [Breznakiella homolactica]|uniref:SDR family oxidoreductase n=1 Tax=Breznakiella homolactica TaxID=2798577 RepID=A0A7T8BBF0_9SPIR|nr:SDR family oxidoreductase [Breznakiella homolactica]QQO09965.1 SDR family oxidoreductase [Breznakiella homolactica]